MPEQEAIATQQRRLLLLESIQRLSRSGKTVTQPELVKDLQSQGYSVEKHHVLRDLRALLEIHPQLECNDFSGDDGARQRGKTFEYRWVGKDAPPETGLSIAEALSLVLVERHLKQALPATLTRALGSLFDRAGKTLDLQKANATARWKDVVQVIPPTQPLVPPTIAEDVLNTVHDALIAEEQIEITYRNARSQEETLRLHPLGLMLREPASYIAALCNDYDDVRLYALHRFTSAKRTYERIRKPEDFSLAEYAIEQGHFGTGRMITLKARIDPRLTGMLEETPLDTSQIIGTTDADGWHALTVRIRDTWQLRWWILSRAEMIVINGPKDIKEAIGLRIKNMAALYT